MTPDEELVACMRTSKKLIDDTRPYLVRIGMGNFFEKFEEYKAEIFSDYPIGQVESREFKTFVWNVMALVMSLKKYDVCETPITYPLPENVVILNDYRKNVALRAAI